MGYFEDKEKELREALRLNPNNALAHNNLGVVLYHLKRYEEAEKEFREALRLKPNLDDAHDNLRDIIIYPYLNKEEEKKRGLK